MYPDWCPKSSEMQIKKLSFLLLAYVCCFIMSKKELHSFYLFFSRDHWSQCRTTPRMKNSSALLYTAHTLAYSFTSRQSMFWHYWEIEGNLCFQKSCTKTPQKFYPDIMLPITLTPLQGELNKTDYPPVNQWQDHGHSRPIHACRDQRPTNLAWSHIKANAVEKNQCCASQPAGMGLSRHRIYGCLSALQIFQISIWSPMGCVGQRILIHVDPHSLKHPKNPHTPKDTMEGTKLCQEHKMNLNPRWV